MKYFRYKITSGGRYDDLLKSLGAKKVFLPLVGNKFEKYVKELITIGLPSKGRLKKKSILFFNDRGLKIVQSKKERNYFGDIENKPNVKIIFLR